VAESTRLVDLVQHRIDRFLDERTREVNAISRDLDPFIDFSRDFLRGGKRFRALFCYWGWQSVRFGDPLELLPSPVPDDQLDFVVGAAAALEVFHAAALVHDDIMDNSDTRRGAASAHKRFESAHRAGYWAGEAAAFGSSSALLLGDLLLGWSDEMFDESVESMSDRDAARAARREFMAMRTQVTVGQYLDIFEEASWVRHDESELLERAHRVVVFKSAKYSVEAPLAIGAALGGGSAEQKAALRAFGLPLGVAYQLRDDLLGVFGDPAVTGKPAGDDLREGKRTVLIAFARQGLPPNLRNLIDELLGDPELDEEQIEALQSAISDSGAIDKSERVIARNVRKAIDAIADAPLSPSAKSELIDLADTVSRRAA
jgi:geranylgeranyl diphosphate synthase type I